MVERMGAALLSTSCVGIELHPLNGLVGVQRTRPLTKTLVADSLPFLEKVSRLVALQVLLCLNCFLENRFSVQTPLASQKVSPLPGEIFVGVEWLCTNLVDPASSHMLVSKIKPCMSQYKLLYGETANGSLKQL